MKNNLLSSNEVLTSDSQTSPLPLNTIEQDVNNNNSDNKEDSSSFTIHPSLLQSRREELFYYSYNSSKSTEETERTPFINKQQQQQNNNKSPSIKNEYVNTRLSSLTQLLMSPMINPIITGNDSMRFTVVFSYSLLAISNSMQWVTFSPVPDEVNLFFQTTTMEVNYLTSVYLIIYALAVVVSCKAFESVGLKKSLTIAALLNMIGASIKLVALYIYPRPLLLFCSQCINALAQVFIIAHPPTIASLWFNDNYRTAANATMTAAQNIGIAIGVVMPTFFIQIEHANNNNNNNNNNKEETILHILYIQFMKFFWTQFVISVIATIAIIFLFPIRPKFAASAMAAEAIQYDLRRSKREHLIEHRKAIEKDLKQKRALQKQHNYLEDKNSENKNPLTSPNVLSSSLNNHNLPESIVKTSSSLLLNKNDVINSNVNTQNYIPLVGEDFITEIITDSDSDDDNNNNNNNSNDVHRLFKNKEAVRRSLAAALAVATEESIIINEDNSYLTNKSIDDIDGIIMNLELKLNRIREAEHENPSINVLHIIHDSFRVVHQNISFALMTVTSSLQLGVAWSLATVIPQIVSPFGVSESMAGWIGFVNLTIGGLTAPVIAPLIVGSKRNYKGALVGCVALLLLDMSIMLMLIIYFVHFSHGEGEEKGISEIKHNNMEIIITLFIGWGAIAGMLQNVILPLLFEFGMELTFPVSEATTATITIWAGNAASFVFTQVFSIILGSNPTLKEAFTSLYIAVILVLFGGISIIAVYPHRFREAYEMNRVQILSESQRVDNTSIIEKSEIIINEEYC